MADIQFAEGLYFNEPHANAPDFIKGKLSVQKEKFMAWLDATDTNDKGYINLDIKMSRDGKPYIAVDTWVPNQPQDQQQAPQATPQQQAQLDNPIEPDAESDIPF
jgi:hypothetical protein